jgi:hypothetical protein
MKRTLAMLMLAGSLASPGAAQDNPLNTARELYASARYDEALLVLNGLRPGSGGGGDLKSIEQYRSLCLLALGRGTEAEAAIAAVVSADPMYLPSEAEASPRVRTAFSEVRQRQLPEIARARYAAAKATFDRKHYPQAEQQFRELLRIIDDPDMGGRLSDLRLLVAGFLDLSAAAAAPPPEPVNETPAAPPVPPPPPKPAFDPDHIFSASDPGVIAPAAVKQEVPRVPSSITAQTRDRGILELVIDQQGRVSSIDVKVRMHPMFDSQLIQAAKDWRYKPAMFEGKPVRYRKLVQINITK